MEIDLNTFLGNIINSPSATPEDRERIVALLLKEHDSKYVTKEQMKEVFSMVEVMKKDFFESKEQQLKDFLATNKKREHKPKDTADFLSLFNRRDGGLKYLTHNYDDAEMSLSDMLQRSRDVFKRKSQQYSIPTTLWSLINTFLNGYSEDKKYKGWVDYNGERHLDGFFSKDWMDWSICNGGKHPILDINGLEKTIQAFRHTIRVVAPDLQTIVHECISDFPMFDFELRKLDRADFFTNVAVMKNLLKSIIKDVCDHTDYKKVIIEFSPGVSGDYLLKTIKMTQKESFSTKSIAEVISRYKSGAGFFYENAIKMRGYCNWSVESKWDGVSKRWNILNDVAQPETEDIPGENLDGFTHILSFYYKD